MSTKPGTKQRFGTLILFLILVVGGGIAIGITNHPGPWYATLQQPSFNPPPWVFAPVWTILYAMIAATGWRLFRFARCSWAMLFWALQLAINFIWSPIFFTLHSIRLAFLVILLLDGTVIATIGASWRRDRWASILMLPYLGWSLFATLLNAALVLLNR